MHFSVARFGGEGIYNWITLNNRKVILMAQPTPTPQTQFTRDIYGRYMCNSFTEAVQSGPFDVVIIGGGAFGLTLAQDLFFRSTNVPALTPDNFRILVLEAGPFALAEHVQDVPNLQLQAFSPNSLLDDSVAPAPSPGQPLPATRQQLVALGLDGTPLMENWGLPWNSNTRFGGLAYCLGGRSLYFGGWSPQYLNTEMHTTPVGRIPAQTLWPQTVVDDLNTRFFAEAAEQAGVTTSNDFLNGALQTHYRNQLAAVYGNLTNVVPLNQLPDHPAGAATDPTLKLDAPLAVQIRTRPGFFPFRKFSSVPLGMTGARSAHGESPNDDTRKRLMIVPNCHVRALRTRTYTLATGGSAQEVDGIDTVDGFLDLSTPIAGNPNRRPVVVLAMGAIESARVALLSAGGVPNAAQIGANLLVHLRKNVAFTVPLPVGLSQQEVLALLVRFRAQLTDGTPVHFHMQVSGAALPAGKGASSSDALLFQNVPDLDNLSAFTQPPGEVDVSIRAVGEMVPNPAANNVTLDQNPLQTDFNVRRAWVNITRSTTDAEVMSLMDAAIDEVAVNVFGAASPNASTKPPDGLGTTFHESSTLRMGDNPAQSVTNTEGQFHYVTNLYAGDAAVLPTCGSANPVMNGIALRRRLAKRLAPAGDAFLQPAPPLVRTSLPSPPTTAGTIWTLFDGTTLANWRMAGRGSFHLVDGALQSVPSFELGLLWYTIPTPQHYRLELEFLISLAVTNSGVLVRFTHPDLGRYLNPAWWPTDSGFEVQIDNSGIGSKGRSNGLNKFRTGSVYDVNYPGDAPGDASPGVPPAAPGDFAAPQNAAVGTWNQYSIEVRPSPGAPGTDQIAVALNGANTSLYTIQNVAYAPVPNRGQFSAGDTYIGLQSYSNYSYTTAFRNIRLTVL
jgi:choline dehydrogenase-like flavoprotein